MDRLENILTVSELNAQIKILLEQNFKFVYLTGELSNFKIHSQSGHYYFTLKDEKSQVQAVMWSSRNQSLLFTPKDGMQVIVTGRISLFGARGTYQIEVWELNPRGIGELQLRFDRLKQKLFDEGLFDEQHKKPLPKFPQYVSILTSKTGAVIHDFIKIIKRRYPILKIYLYPVAVQGNEASRDLINAIKSIEKLLKMHKIPQIDLIVIARGGGSLEDLWSFNDENLARAIFDCKIPVVSAVGHEVDFTICDFVADLRAPTPSVAAELITPDINELIENLSKFSYFYKNLIKNKVDALKNSIKEIQSNYYFNRPRDIIFNYYQRIDEMSRLLTNITNNRVLEIKNKIKAYKSALHHISPDNNLKKGYALVFRNELDIFSSGAGSEKDFTKLITRASELDKYDEVDIKFHDNKKTAKIID
jgi:exodeoxyribonuclease VII large subunit